MIPLTPTNLLVAQILAHAGLLYSILYGNIFWWVVTMVVYFLNGCLGMTMTYHRLLSHKSWHCPKILEYLFAGFAGIGLTGSALSWVSVHRQHHRFTDTAKDPHSPVYRSWFYCHFLSMYSKVELKYVPDLLRQQFYVKQHQWYFELACIWGILAVIIFQDINALAYAWLAPAAILWNAGSSIVSISHRKNKINNDLSLALLVWGEGYHKNHHDHAGKYRFGSCDPGGIMIHMIQKIFNNNKIGEIRP